MFTRVRIESSTSESLQTIFDPVLYDAMLPRDCLLEQGWSPVFQNPFKLSSILFYLMLCSPGIVHWSKDEISSNYLQSCFTWAMFPWVCLLEQRWSPCTRNPFKLSSILFYLMLCSLGIVWWSKNEVLFFWIPSNYVWSCFTWCYAP